MSGKLIRTAVAAALVLGVAIAVVLVGGSGASPADAANPHANGSGPQVLTAESFATYPGDVRHIPPGRLKKSGEQGEPKDPKDALPGTAVNADPALQTTQATSTSASSPSSFAGLDFNGSGAGWPPDPNGDVGPANYVETVNTSVGIFGKDGAPQSNVTFDSLFSAAGTGTPCDNSNQGDPVALYDPYGDRFIVADFAWADAQYSTGPFYECIAVSKTSNPLSGGWNFYAWKVETGSSLPDYPKLGVWPDGIYMSANVFSSTGAGSFQNVQVWAFDRTAMEAGDPNAKGVTFAVPKTVGGTSVFSLLPSNSRVATGAPPVGSPNYFASIYGSYAIRVWKFHVDWTTPANSTFTGPTDISIATFNVGPASVPELGGNNIDTLSYRLMMQNQYTNLNGRESLWLTHTVGSSTSVAQPRWYELPVTGGTISAVRQQSTWAPDTLNRFMPSLAVDKNGDTALGYSVSGANMHPALRYSGRLAADPLSTLTQAEQTIVQGAGFQCCKFSDGSTNTRWGDYSSMTIDPSDGCTFWYTGEYYDATPTTLSGDNWKTRIGTFQLPGCTSSVAAPTVSGFSPTSGPAGTSVTVTGTGFTGATAVKFNGAAATFGSVTDTQLTATVPTAAASGPISVTTPGGTGSSTTSFTVAAGVPAVTSFTPASGPVGTSVTINGTNLSGVSSVKFNGVAATTFSAGTGTQATATVPAGATSGVISVTTPGGTATSSSSFTVTTTAAAPTIASISPTSGPVGTVVTINGANLNGTSSVKFGGGVSATFTVVSTAQITTTVPNGAATGGITVTTPGGSATSRSFRVSKH